MPICIVHNVLVTWILARVQFDLPTSPERAGGCRGAGEEGGGQAGQGGGGQEGASPQAQALHQQVRLCVGAWTDLTVRSKRTKSD